MSEQDVREQVRERYAARAVTADPGVNALALVDANACCSLSCDDVAESFPCPMHRSTW